MEQNHPFVAKRHCQQCKSKWESDYRKTHRLRYNELRRASYHRNREAKRLYFKKRYAENPEVRMASLVRGRKYRQEHAAEISERQRHHKVEIKRQTLSHYANGIPKCACCGESELTFLVLDHIENNGGEERKTMKVGTGLHFYTYLRNRNYPTGYQVLCFNCNMGKSFLGVCPHQHPVLKAV